MITPPHITRDVYRNDYLAHRKSYYSASAAMLDGKIKAMYRRLMENSRKIWAQAFKECV